MSQPHTKFLRLPTPLGPDTPENTQLQIKDFHISAQANHLRARAVMAQYTDLSPSERWALTTFGRQWRKHTIGSGRKLAPRNPSALALTDPTLSQWLQLTPQTIASSKLSLEDLGL